MGLVQWNPEEVSLELSGGVSVRVGIESRGQFLLPDHLNPSEFLIGHQVETSFGNCGSSEATWQRNHEGPS